MMNERSCWTGTTLCALITFLLTACSPSGQQKETADPAFRQPVRLVYVEWVSCVAATQVVRAALEKQGYRVKATAVSAAAMYSALANGAADATVCAWLPTVHANYYARTRTRLDNLGFNMKGVRVGLVVPDYVSVESIAQLGRQADRFDHQIIGIDPGAGEMSMTQKVIKDYHLPMKLIDGSGATMTAALKSAIDNHRWIVVTGWTPHWMWERWKLKYLADPRGLYGSSEQYIATMAAKGFKKGMPGAWRILAGFHWTSADMEALMLKNQQPDADPRSNALAWVKTHASQVAAWTSGSK